MCLTISEASLLTGSREGLTWKAADDQATLQLGMSLKELGQLVVVNLLVEGG